MTSASTLPHADDLVRLVALEALQVLPVPAEAAVASDAARPGQPQAARPDAASDPTDRALRQLVAEAAAACGAPTALLSLIDIDRQHVWMRHGSLPVTGTSRHPSFCTHALAAEGDVLEVPSALDDARFASHPWVAGAPAVRFYAGAPIALASEGLADGGVRIGALCVLDTAPRTLTPFQRERLAGLAALAGTLLDDRRRRLALARDLRASETRYRAMVEDQTDLVALVDADGRLRYANTAFAALFGRTPDEMTGLVWCDLLPAGEGASLRGQLRQARDRGLPVLGETRVGTSRDGQRWIEWTHRAVASMARPMPGAAVAPVDADAAHDDGAVHSVGRDVTARKHLERELFVSESRYRSLFDHMQSGFALHELLLDAEGRPADVRFLAVNAAHARMMGLAQERIVDATLTDLYGHVGAEFEFLLKSFAPVALEGTTVRFEHYVRPLDRWVDIVAYRPAPMQFASIAEDVTERKRAQHELQAQHEQLRVTLHSIGDAVITTDNAGRVQYLNPVAERLTGWDDAYAHGERLDAVFRIIDDETRDPLPNLVRRCLAAARRASAVDVELPFEPGDDEDDVAARDTVYDTSGLDTTPGALGELVAQPATLIHRLGTEAGIEASVAPICAADGSVLGAVLVFRDVTDQRRMAREMSYRATHDALTGLVNRSDFESRLQHTLRLAHTDGSAHALMYIDLDQFKLVNDACGHAAGDQLLRQVSELLSQCVRSRDTLARLGGDEFGVILEFCSTEQAQRVAEQICERMDEYRFVQDDRRFRIGTSIGLVPLDGRWPTTQSVLQAADAACYAAKEAGRNRVHAWFDADHHLRLRHGEMQWVTQLEQALDDERFELFGQRIAPIRATEDGLHLEVLLRLRGPDGAIVAPGAFLPAAERFHLATRIDRWVVATVVSWMARHRDRLTHVSTIAVNLSGQSIGDAAFLRHVNEILEATDFDAGKLCFEITETAAITSMAEAKAFILAMQSHGIRFALDDFGAGASGFGYLKTLPVDYLKIDGQFVRDLMDDPLDRAAIRCFREVAAAVGTQTIAEFVETDAIADMLSQLGIDYGQGYLYHRPEPLDAAAGI
jgi:diguanylate cyclase (GGDEF)-like protein/PAS domain S-box-containing protein